VEEGVDEGRLRVGRGGEVGLPRLKESWIGADAGSKEERRKAMQGGQLENRVRSVGRWMEEGGERGWGLYRVCLRKARSKMRRIVEEVRERLCVVRGGRKACEFQGREAVSVVVAVCQKGAWRL
jgi:hypothetical protein